MSDLYITSLLLSHQSPIISLSLPLTRMQPAVFPPYLPLRPVTKPNPMPKPKSSCVIGFARQAPIYPPPITMTKKFPLVGKSTGKRQIHCSCWDLIPSCGRIYTSYYQTTEAQGWIPTYSTGDQGRGGVAQWVGLRVPASAEGFGFGG